MKVLKLKNYYVPKITADYVLQGVTGHEDQELSAV